MAIVFFDIDGTILNHRTNKITEKTILAIKKLKENGHIPVLATGRNKKLLMGLEELLGIDALVLSNGHYVLYNKECIYAKYIDKKIVKRFIDYASVHNYDVAISTALNHVAISDTGQMTKFNESLHLGKIEVKPTYYLDHDVLQMNICANDKIDELRIEFPELEFAISTQYGLDVTLKEGFKELGVKQLLDFLKIDLKETFAIGDGYNDIGMIKTVYTGIAMGNACDELKKEAVFTTLSIDFDGVYYTLKYYGLI